MGRIPTYTDRQSIQDQVIVWLSEGKTLRDFCRQPGMPSFWTVYQWKAESESFASRFAQARDVGEEIILSECLEIADDGSNDWLETRKGKQLDREHVERSKLRIDARLKLLAKWNPSKYGDRLAIDQRNTLIQLQLSGPLAERLVGHLSKQLDAGQVIDAVTCASTVDETRVTQSDVAAVQGLTSDDK